jgi:TPR repeat protein
VKKDLKKALQWYEASMLQGFDEAKDRYLSIIKNRKK